MSEALCAMVRDNPPYVPRRKAQELLGYCSANLFFRLLGEGHIRAVKRNRMLLVDTMTIAVYLGSLPEHIPPTPK